MRSAPAAPGPAGGRGGPPGGAGPRRRVFRSPAAVAVWYVWLLFAVLNLADLAIRGRDHTSATLAAVLALVTGVVYVTALRPRVVADDDSITLRNPLCDVRVPWGAVASIDLGDMIRVHCEAEAVDAGTAGRRRVVHGWALHASRRRQVKARMRAKARAAATAASPGFARMPEQARALAALPPAAAAVAELDEWRGQARQRGAPGGKPIVTWSLASIAALVVPAVLVAAVAAVH